MRASFFSNGLSYTRSITAVEFVVTGCNPDDLFQLNSVATFKELNLDDYCGADCVPGPGAALFFFNCF